MGVVLAATIGLLSAPAARAGEYTVHTCRFPDNSEAGIGAWHVIDGEFASILGAWESCPAGAYQLSMDFEKAHPADHFMDTTFVAPQSTEITDYSIWRSTELSPEFNYYLHATPAGAAVQEQCTLTCLGKGSWSAHVAART